MKSLFSLLLVLSLFHFALPADGDELKNLEITAVEESPVNVDDREAYDNLKRLVTVMKLLQRLYVDPEKVSMQKLVDGALKGMLNELDPYSSYETIQEKKSHEKTERIGIGIMAVKSKRIGFKVICALKGSPAAKNGVKVGDLIIKVNNKMTGDLNYQQCADLLRGKPGTKVKIEIVREGQEDPLMLEIIRAAFKQEHSEFKDVRVLDNDIGYIRISGFTDKTVLFLDKALKILRKKKCRALILDLRNNPGGLVDVAVAVCSRFLDSKELVITIEGRDLKKAQKVFSVDCSRDKQTPLLILVNRFSASAAEIVAGCMKDHKRALLLGSRTFGKGSVQRVCKIKDDGTLRFTVAKYYTPAHNVIHGKGIEPDIKLPLSLQKRLNLAQQLEEHPGLLHPADKTMMNDLQLEKAVEVLRGKLKAGKEKK